MANLVVCKYLNDLHLNSWPKLKFAHILLRETWTRTNVESVICGNWSTQTWHVNQLMWLTTLITPQQLPVSDHVPLISMTERPNPGILKPPTEEAISCPTWRTSFIIENALSMWEEETMSDVSGKVDCPFDLQGPFADIPSLLLFFLYSMVHLVKIEFF